MATTSSSSKAAKRNANQFVNSNSNSNPTDLPSDSESTCSSCENSSASSDDETAVVFFGKPSAEEQEKRQKYQQQLRTRKLIRRDSLDLARRRTLVLFDPDQTDADTNTNTNTEQDASVSDKSVLQDSLTPQHVQQGQESLSLSTSSAVSEQDPNTKGDKDTTPGVDLQPANSEEEQDADNKDEEEYAADDDDDDDSDDDDQLQVEEQEKKEASLEKSKKEQSLPNITGTSSTNTSHSTITNTTTDSHKDDSTNQSYSDSGFDETVALDACEQRFLDSPSRSTIRDRAVITTALDFDETLALYVCKERVQNQDPSPTSVSEDVVESDSAEIFASESSNGQLKGPTNTTSPSFVEKAQIIAADFDETLAIDVCEERVLQMHQNRLDESFASLMFNVLETSTGSKQPLVDLHNDQQDQEQPTNSECENSRHPNLGSESFSTESDTDKQDWSDNSDDSSSSRMPREGNDDSDDSSSSRMPLEDSDDEEKDSDISAIFNSSNLLLQNVLPSPSAVTMQTPVRASNGEAAILARRSGVACTPSSSASFSFDCSPGLARTAVAPTPDALRRSIIGNALGSDYFSSPRLQRTPQSACGSFTDQNTAAAQDRRGRRSARLSQGSAICVLVSSQDKGNSTYSVERKALESIAGLQQTLADKTHDSDMGAKCESRSIPNSPNKRAKLCCKDSADVQLNAKNSPLMQKENLFSGTTPDSPRKGNASVRLPSSPVRIALNAWANAKLVTPFSPEKNNSHHATSMSPKASNPFDRPTSSPVKFANIAAAAAMERPGAALFSKSLRSSSPVKRPRSPDLPELSNPPRQISLQSPLKTSFMDPSSAALLPTRYTETPTAVATTHVTQDSAVTAFDHFAVGESEPPSALKTPRLASRTLTANKTDALRTANRGAGILSQAPRKIDNHVGLLMSTCSAPPPSTTLPSSINSTAVVTEDTNLSSAIPARKFSSLPRPVQSRLPKPASAIPTPSASKLARPAASCNLATERKSQTLARSTAVPTAASNASASSSSSLAPRPVTMEKPPSGSTLRVNSMATPSSSSSSSLSVTASNGIRGPGATARLPSTVMARSLAAPSLPTAASTVASSPASGQGHGHGSGFSSDSSAGPVSSTALSMLQRSTQMQARALARRSPDNNETTCTMSSKPPLNASQGSASRVWSPVKPSATGSVRMLSSPATNGGYSHMENGGSGSGLAGRARRVPVGSGEARGVSLSKSTATAATVTATATVGGAGLASTSASSNIRAAFSSASTIQSRLGPGAGSSYPRSTTRCVSTPAAVPVVAAGSSESDAHRGSRPGSFAVLGGTVGVEGLTNEPQPVRSSTRSKSLRSSTALRPSALALNDSASTSSTGTTTSAAASVTITSPSAPISHSIKNTSATTSIPTLSSSPPPLPPTSSSSSPSPQPTTTTTTTLSSSSRPRRHLRSASVSASTTTTTNKTVSRSTSTPSLSLSATELTRLTTQHTRKNEVYLSKLDIRIERREGPRPPSPTPELCSSFVQRCLFPSSSSSSSSASSHILAKGDEKIYTTPPKSRIRWSKSLFSGPAASSSNRIGKPNLISKPCSSSTTLLDRNGNLVSNDLKPLSPSLKKTKVIIRKIVYDDDEIG